MGCYRDSSTRDLPNWLLTDFTSLSIESCITTCLNSDYPYAGVQAGYFFSNGCNYWELKTYYKNFKSYACFCGNSYGSQGTATNCNSPCSGNSNEICGGGWANSVYSTQCSYLELFFI